MVTLGSTSLELFPLNLGGNPFGYTADEAESHAVLDAFRAAGGNFIDLADVYGGQNPGASETIVGSWLAKRSDRDELVIASKVSYHPDRFGLAADNVIAAAEDSLRRLGIDHIDLYYAHADDQSMPMEETFGAFDQLVQSGKVRYTAGSNYGPDRIEEALATQDREGLARWVALQPEYSLMERGFEQDGRQAIAARENLAVMPYYALAHGFLTGKYRSTDDAGLSQRGEGAVRYLDGRGLNVLDALEQVSYRHGVEMASAAIAWLAAQPTVTAPLASARTPEQVGALMAGATLQLEPEEIQLLTTASAQLPG